MNLTLNAVLPGLLVGGVLAGLVLVYAPRSVRAGDALNRLGEAAIAIPVTAAPLSQWDRAGSWLAQHLPNVKFIGPPLRDLDLLDIPVSRFYARKIQGALFGFATPAILSALLGLITGQPFLTPLILSPVLAFVMWISVDSQIAARATAARREFTRFVGVYLQMVAVALLGNTTADSALSSAASLSDTWVLRRIRREYAAADLPRTSKWDAIERLGTQLEIPSLTTLGRTMRLSEARVGLRDQLIASANKLRTEVSAADTKAAEKVTRAATVPVFLTLFPIILLATLPSAFALFNL